MTAGRARSTLANVEIRELQLGPCGAFNCARNQKQNGEPAGLFGEDDYLRGIRSPSQSRVVHVVQK